MSFLTPKEVKYLKNGNSTRDVPKLRSMYGANSFTRKPRKTFFRQYLSAFGDPIIKILLIALALNLIIAIKSAQIYEPLGIAAALFLATFVSTLSEYGSESAFLKLEEQSADAACRVIRDGKVENLSVFELVVNDTVMLSAGERVPADGIITTGNVLVNQSALNGESTEVKKYPSVLADGWDISETNQLFSGSVVTSGECIMSVGRTGDSSFYGNVASEIQTDSGKSPLTEKLTKLADTLAKIGYLAAGLVFFADIFNTLVIDNNFDIPRITAELCSLPEMVTNLLHAVTLAITVVVVAVPEGLPMMITVVLSSNMKRLKRDNVLVRKLVGIETCGGLNMLFCDKTGTLTTGNLTVTGFTDLNGKTHVTVPNGQKQDVIYCCVYNNESTLINKKACGGNATDRALLTYFNDGKRDNALVKERIPFDSEKKYSAVRIGDMWYIKGAPEMIFGKCKNVTQEITRAVNEQTGNGVRVIALAKSSDMRTYTLVGLVSVNDKIRRDAVRSVRTVKNAGISVCMVTGDNVNTARDIASRCGILEKDGAVLTSTELARLSDAELCKILPKLNVVARAMPGDKSRLVRVCRSMNLVCGMTGDGINDAPALKQADVGFAMGSGTEVAKQAGDIIILDDNFTSIAKAILYGRTIFKSIRKFIVFQLTMNLCAVGVSVIGPFIGIDTPVTVMQMLWINIIMDTLAGLAYAGEPPKKRYMNEKPMSRTENVMNKKMTGQILSMGLYNLCMSVAFLSLECFRKRFGYYTDETSFMTAFFTLFIFSGVFGSLNARSERANIFSGLLKNRAFVLIFLVITSVSLWLIYYGGDMFRTYGLALHDLLPVLLLSATVVPFDVIRKLFLCKHG